MNTAPPSDLLALLAVLLRALTLFAGLIIGGGAAAGLLLRRLGVPPAEVERAATRLALPLLALLLAAALPLAVVETLWQTRAPLNGRLLLELLPYTIRQTLFGMVWLAQTGLLLILAFRLWRWGRAPGPLAAVLLLSIWPQVGHLEAYFMAWDPGALAEMGRLAAHRLGVALWPAALGVLLAWSRPAGPAHGRQWGAAFTRLALPGAALLIGGAVGTLSDHGGLSTLTTPIPFAPVAWTKIGLLLVLLALGTLHFRRSDSQESLTGRTTAAEVAFAAAAAALGALLGILPSPD